MKKLLSVLFAVIILCSLAACGGNGSADVTADGEGAGENSVGNVEENASKTAPVPDEEYVLYKETGTKSNIVRDYVYNSDGRLSKIVKTGNNGSVSETVFEYTDLADGGYTVYEKGEYTDYIRKYDAEGRLVEEIEEPEDDAETTVYTYGENGVVDAKTFEDGRLSDHWVRTFEDGLVMKEEQYLSNGNLLGYIEYHYDENGNETTHKFYNSDGEQTIANSIYYWIEEYDSFGRIIKTQKRDVAIDGLYFEEIYEYDENGGMCKATSMTGGYVREYRPLSECIK
ncbi:MAG: hypothetical protein IKU61_03050 [Clostridia bacterium]|nr:hypothetical protein [Clostridia bacterium]